MITAEHKQEALSRAYIHAVAAQAGVNYALGYEFDYGFDGHFRPVVTRGTRRVASGVQLDFQLKCSFVWSADEEHITYALKSKNYNDLVTREPEGIGAILILMCLPREEADWITINEDSVTLKKCCYYATLSGSPIDNENSTKTLKIPRKNLLTADNLHLALAEERTRRLGAF